MMEFDYDKRIVKILVPRRPRESLLLPDECIPRAAIVIVDAHLNRDMYDPGPVAAGF